MWFLESFRKNIGMDVNEFYSALITLLTVVVPVIVAVFTSIKSKVENNLLDLHAKEENNFFYFHILLLELIFAFLSACVVYFTLIMMTMLEMDYWLLYLVIYILLTLVSFGLLYRMSFVRKRLLGKRKYRWLIYAPLIIFNIDMYTTIMGVETDIVRTIGVCLVMVLEYWGMLVFKAQYIQYQYSGAIFYLNNGNEIDCKDISTITRRYKSLIIKEHEKQIRFKYDDISWVKYYGGIRLKFFDKEMALKVREFDSVENRDINEFVKKSFIFNDPTVL